MNRHMIHKCLIALLTVYIIITISFLLVHMMPGDPVIHLVGQEEYYYLLDNAPETLNDLIEQYGLNDGLPTQYIRYLKNILSLDFGIAYSNKEPVLNNIVKAARWTLLLSVPTWIAGGILGAMLGVMAGWKPGKWFDKITTPIFLAVNVIPSNCLCLIFLIFFAYKWRLFPINGMVAPGLTGAARTWNILEHMTLPLIILILFRMSGDFMLMKSAVSQTRKEEYITTADSKGIGEQKVLFRHVLRNAALPYMTSMCMQMGALLSGSMIVEVVFGWKGMGTLMYNAVLARDFPTAQACFLISAVCVVITNLLSDMLNSLIDPRIREAVAHEG